MPVCFPKHHTYMIPLALHWTASCSQCPTATLKGLLPTKQKCYDGDWFSRPWANLITTKPPFLTLCCVSAYHHTGEHGSHPLWPHMLFLACLTPHQGLCSVRDGSRQKGSLDHVAWACSVSSGASRVICPAALCLVVGFTVVQVWGTMGFFFFATVPVQNLSTSVGSERLKILLCPSGHFVFLGKPVNVAECNI